MKNQLQLDKKVNPTVCRKCSQQVMSDVQCVSNLPDPISYQTKGHRSEIQSKGFKMVIG